jgi:hypothetical protein
LDDVLISEAAVLGTSVVALVSASSRVVDAKAALKERRATRDLLIGRGRTVSVHEIDMQITKLVLHLASFESALTSKIEEVQRAFDAHHGLPSTFAASAAR